MLEHRWGVELCLASCLGVGAARACRYVVCGGSGVGGVEGVGRRANGSPESGWSDWAVAGWVRYWAPAGCPLG